MMSFKEYLNKIHREDDFGILSESHLNRILQQIDSNIDFAIISASRYNFSKSENVKRNNELIKILREKIKSNKIGAYKLVGHWKECSKEIDKCNISFKEYQEICKNSGGKIIDNLEYSWFITIPNNFDKIFKILIELAKKFDQDAFILRHNRKISLYDKNGMKYFDFKNKSAKEILSIGFQKILELQGYSQFKKDRDKGKCRFLIFEMFSVKPDDTNSSHLLFKILGIN